MSVTYPTGHQALKSVSLSFVPGEFIAVVGLSGAGKSTLIRCINRLVTPTSGSLTVNGVELVGLDETPHLQAMRQITTYLHNLLDKCRALA